MAHCIHLSDSEIELIKKRNTGVSHCPNSNFRSGSSPSLVSLVACAPLIVYPCISVSLMSGVMPLRKYLDRGLKIGLGTDVSGGYAPSILDAIKLVCTSVSKL